MLIELEDGSVLGGKVMDTEVIEVDKAMVAIVSTENVDSDGDIIHAGKTPKGAGWVLDTFNKNPVIQWYHEPFRPNLAAPEVRAKVQKAEGGGRVLVLDPFAFDMADPFAAEIAGKYQRKVLKNTSVGFRGLKWDRMMDGDMMSGREFFEQQLIEVSAVNVGANQETSTVVKSMLARHGFAAKVQGGGDSEVAELKAEIAHLREEQEYYRRELTMIENVVKSLGDEKSTCNAEKVLVARAAEHAASNELDLAATAILLRLRSLGAAQ